MKTVSVNDAIGLRLAHDLTQIIIGGFGGARFKRGHVVRQEDIPVLLSMGKKSIYVLEPNDTDVHEEEAALRIAKTAVGANLEYKLTGEGKVNVFSTADGVLRVNAEKLYRLVEDDNVMFTTLPQYATVKVGTQVAGTRVIPLFVSEETVRLAEDIGTVMEVLPFIPRKIGVVTTGSEVYEHLIEDKFGPVLCRKFEELNCPDLEQVFADDSEEMIAEKILQLCADGAELICVTGGMSVDPDDRTPAGIRRAGVTIQSYGAPFLPGAMFLLGYLDELPVLGLPGCVMHHPFTVFDVLVPRIIAGEKLTRDDVKALALGGLNSTRH